MIKVNRIRKKPLEHDIQNAIARILMLKGYLVIRYNSGAVVDEGKRFVKFYTIMNNKESKGHPDLMFMRNGKSWFVEVKRPKEKLRPSQEKFCEIAKFYGMTVIVATSWEQVHDYVNNLETN